MAGPLRDRPVGFATNSDVLKVPQPRAFPIWSGSLCDPSEWVKMLYLLKMASKFIPHC